MARRLPLKEYRAFRKKYAPLLRAAKREMETDMQRGLVDAIARTAFLVGYNTGAGEAQPEAPVVLKPWRPNGK